MLTAIRGTGASNICVLDAPVWGNDIGHRTTPPTPRAFEAGMAPALLATHGNLLLSQHNYGAYDAYTAQSDYDAYVSAVQGAGLALMHGEIGAEFTGAKDQNVRGVVVSLTSRDRHVGALWWAVNFTDYYRLHSDGSDLTPENDGRGYTASGQAFVDYLKA